MARDDQKNLVRESTDIVELVGSDVALHRKGREFVCVCPFHDDTKPSCCVVPHKQIYHCFACGASGDVFTWMMEYHKMSFPEALEELAKRAGIELEKYGGNQVQNQQAKSEREMLAEANKEAEQWFRQQLTGPVGETARSYIGRRDISDEMIEAFGIGYAPDGWDAMVQAIRKFGWSRQAFEMAGLVQQRQNRDGHYDRLRHRLIFPIYDGLGRPIAFGGRKLREEDEPKYLNSPETRLFNKSATLYGLHQAKKPIIDTGTAVIVEGYTDVIACHQYGAKNVVATLGTALTEQHVKQLRRYAERVVLVFDGDEAGQRAADRALPILLPHSIETQIAILPDNSDPDELLPKLGIEWWDNWIANSNNLFDHLYRSFSVGDDPSAIRRNAAVTQFMDKVVHSGYEDCSPGRRNELIRTISQVAGVSDSNIADRFRELLKRNQNARLLREGQARISESLEESSPTPFEPFTTKAKKRAQFGVIGCLLNEPNLYYELDVDEELPVTELSGDHKGLMGFLEKRYERDLSNTLVQVVSELNSIGFTELAKLAIKASKEIEKLVSFIAYSFSGLLRAHLDALRFMREEAEYLAERSKFMRKYLNHSASDAEIDEFLHSAYQFFNSHPSPLRIYRGRDTGVEAHSTNVDEFESYMSANLAS